MAVLNEKEIAAMEDFAAEHGLAALLDRLGLDGLGNEVNDLRRVAKAAERHALRPTGLNKRLASGDFLFIAACRVYWGSHGCCLERGHNGHHECGCCDCEDHPDPDSGCVGKHPYYGWDTWFYGEDAPRQPLIKALHWWREKRHRRRYRVRNV